MGLLDLSGVVGNGESRGTFLLVVLWGHKVTSEMLLLLLLLLGVLLV